MFTLFVIGVLLATIIPISLILVGAILSESLKFTKAASVGELVASILMLIAVVSCPVGIGLGLIGLIGSLVGQ